MAEFDPAAWIAAARDRNEHWITRMALTEASVADSPFGDLRKAVAALEAVLALAGEFDTEDGITPEDAQILGRPVSRGDRIREAIASELLGKEQSDA
jgi:hypothetical protein